MKLKAEAEGVEFEEPSDEVDWEQAMVEKEKHDQEEVKKSSGAEEKFQEE